MLCVCKGVDFTCIISPSAVLDGGTCTEHKGHICLIQTICVEAQCGRKVAISARNQITSWMGSVKLALRLNVDPLKRSFPSQNGEGMTVTVRGVAHLSHF